MTPGTSAPTAGRVRRGRNISTTVKCLLWGRSAGRCELCNEDVSRSPTSLRSLNAAESGHIWSWADNGPRGNSGIAADRLNELENLILVCRACHKEIDTYTEPFPAARLIAAKSAHERRVALATAAVDDRRTH